MEEEVVAFEALLDEILLDEAFNAHWMAKVTIAERKDESRSQQLKDKSSLNPLFVICSVCGESVYGKRYAPHLEKCMNGGKRGGARRQNLSSAQSTGSNSPPPPKKIIKEKEKSLIVKLKLSEGYVIPGQKRTLVSAEYYSAKKSQWRRHEG